MQPLYQNYWNRAVKTIIHCTFSFVLCDCSGNSIKKQVVLQPSCNYGTFASMKLPLRIKKILLFIGLSFLISPLPAQMEPALQKRLDGFLAVTKTVNIDELLNYMYPKVFILATREKLPLLLHQTIIDQLAEYK